jgi:hypothetical protein
VQGPGSIQFTKIMQAYKLLLRPVWLFTYFLSAGVDQQFCTTLSYMWDLFFLMFYNFEGFILLRKR